MSGACRESMRVWTNPRGVWRSIWHPWPTIIKDNLGPVACFFLGHDAYNTALAHEPPEHACRRCGTWRKELDPKEWRCEQHATVYPLPGVCPQCREHWTRESQKWMNKQPVSPIGQIRSNPL